MTNTLLRQFGQNLENGSCAVPPLFDDTYFEPDCGDADVTCTEKQKKWLQSDSGGDACGPGCGTATVTVDVTWNLSDQDLPADAIARFLANTSWSAWIPGGGCVAGWGATEFGSFPYATVEWRVVRSGLLPSTSYQVSVPMLRRVYGTGAYILYQTVTTTVTTSPTGALSVSGDVPNDEGYQTYAGLPVVTKL